MIERKKKERMDFFFVCIKYIYREKNIHQEEGAIHIHMYRTDGIYYASRQYMYVYNISDAGMWKMCAEIYIDWVKYIA